MAYQTIPFTLSRQRKSADSNEWINVPAVKCPRVGYTVDIHTTCMSQTGGCSFYFGLTFGNLLCRYESEVSHVYDTR